MSPLITILGSLNIDLVTVTPHVPAAGETITATSFSTGFGGKGANQAAACARLSRKRGTKSDVPAIDVRMIGAVGDDQFGTDITRSLKSDGIDVAQIRRLSGQSTGTATILVEEGGENRIMVTPGANHGLKVEDELLDDQDIRPDGEVLVMQLEIPLEVVLANLEKAKRRGVTTVFNPAPAQEIPDSAFPLIDYLIMNETESAILSGHPASEAPSGSDEAKLNDLCELFLSKGVKAVIITLGAEGVYYRTIKSWKSNETGTKQPAVKAKVVDTTAAGDTFVGACAVKMASLAGQDNLENTDTDLAVHKAIGFAMVAAAKTVEKLGAQSAIPFLDELPPSPD